MRLRRNGRKQPQNRHTGAGRYPDIVPAKAENQEIEYITGFRIALRLYGMTKIVIVSPYRMRCGDLFGFKIASSLTFLAMTSLFSFHLFKNDASIILFNFRAAASGFAAAHIADTTARHSAPAFMTSAALDSLIPPIATIG